MSFGKVYIPIPKLMQQSGKERKGRSIDTITARYIYLAVMALSTDLTTQLLEREAAKEGKAFTWQQLKEAYIALAARRELLPAPRFDRVLGALLLTGRLRQVEVRPEKKKRQDRSSYKSFIRYTLSGATPLDLAASLRPGGYFSHSTAATLHGLLKAEAISVVSG